MKTIPVCSWEECQAKFKELEQLRNELTSEKNWSDVSNLFYRGQADAQNWKLETTLERRLHNYRISFDNYYGLIWRIKPEIQSFSSKDWQILTIYEFHDWLKEADFSVMGIPGIEYMIYLRHHGFPSPLLDWTRSPFIAAYFAFQNINKDAKSVSIYANIEYAGKGKRYWSKGPLISTIIRPSGVTHSRHFLQQCEYTICTIKNEDKIFFASHEKVFYELDKEQDLLWKINIPSTERPKVLSHLESMNINAFSLFGSEESLMATLAIREFDLKKREELDRGPATGDRGPEPKEFPLHTIEFVVKGQGSGTKD